MISEKERTIINYAFYGMLISPINCLIVVFLLDKFTNLLDNNFGLITTIICILTITITIVLGFLLGILKNQYEKFDY